MTDRGLKVLYVFKSRITQELHDGIDCVNQRILKDFLQRPGIRYAFWFAEEDIELTEEEEDLLNSKLIYLHPSED